MSAAAFRSSSGSGSGSVNTEATGSSPSAQLLKLTAIDNLELFAAKALTYIHGLPDPVIPTYHVLSPSRGADMLSWSVKVRASKGVPAHEELRVQIQDIGDGLARIGAIGDGNCMVHSMFTATSPTYRAQNMEVRQAIADRFRDTLSVRMDELRALADIIYVEQGGSVAFYDAFENLEEGVDRTEIDMELGPVISQLYGFNYLAVSLDDRLNMLPVRQTLLGRRPDLPTVLIHYIGGALEGGRGVKAANFSKQGHYEVIVRPVVAGGAAAGRASSSRRVTTARKDGVLPDSGTIMLSEVATTFMFTEEELAGVLAKFGNLNSAANMSPRTKEVFLRSVARKREEGVELSPATRRTLAALEKKASMGLLRSSSSRSGASVSSETLAAIQALGAKKSSSPKRSTRKTSTKPVGGAGAPAPTRRSTRATTQKKRKSSSSSRGSSSVSPSILAAIAAMEAASLKAKSK